MATGLASLRRTPDRSGENAPRYSSDAAGSRGPGARAPRPPLRTIQPPASRVGGGAAVAKTGLGKSGQKPLASGAARAAAASSGPRLSTAAASSGLRRLSTAAASSGLRRLSTAAASSGLRLSTPAATARAQGQWGPVAAERIRVSVRVRPISAEEARRSPWRVSGNTIALTQQPAVLFKFEKIFGEDCRTADVYEGHAKNIVDAVVRGFNGTVFAYGQTNSGKMYTMRGSDSEPGVILLAVGDLFRQIEENMDREFIVRMSYMEIYNEKITDLLVPEHQNLIIQESKEGVIQVGGLKEEIVTGPVRVMDFILAGECHRRVGETNMNLNSSRSHSIIRLVVESREKVDGSKIGGSSLRVSVLNLVDLAGSESARKTGAKGVRQKEGGQINQSLLTLGKIIESLSQGTKSKGCHLPYRDSKLTRILQPALGGNANTAIICNITLSKVHADETKNGLQFASRALRVTNCACINEILKEPELIRRKKKEIEELRAQLTVSQSGEQWKEVLNLQNRLHKTELEKEKIFLELEEKKAKEEQAKRIENLNSRVLNSERYEKNTVLSEVCGPVQEGPTSCVNKHEHNLGMPPPFKELIQGSYASNGELFADTSSSGDTSKDDADVFLPDSHAFPHDTSQINSDENPAVEAVKPAPLLEDPESSDENLEMNEDSSDENYWPKSSEFEWSNVSEQIKHSDVSEQPELHGSDEGNVRSQTEFESQEQMSPTAVEPVIEFESEEQMPPVALIQDRMPVDYARASSAELKKLRSRNHYKGPRTATDRRFWSIEQQDLYTYIYSKAKVADMKWINWANISDIRERCVHLGLEKIMCYCCDWDDELIRQFYSTVYISADKTVITWMTEGRMITTNKRAWEQMFGVPHDVHTALHSQLFLNENDRRILYKDAECTLGSISGLSPLASVVNKIIRTTIYPRAAGNAIHKHNWNVLHHIVKQDPFDIISLIFGEIDLVLWDRSHTKDLLYAPYIMAIILKAFKYEGPRESKHRSYRPMNNSRCPKLSKKLGNQAASSALLVSATPLKAPSLTFQPFAASVKRKTTEAPPVAVAPLEAPFSAFCPEAASVGHESDIETVDAHRQFEADVHQPKVLIQPITCLDVKQVVESEFRPINHPCNKMKLQTKVCPLATPSAALVEAPPVVVAPLEEALSAFQPDAIVGHESTIEQFMPPFNLRQPNISPRF